MMLPEFTPVTEPELARARSDPGFRRQLLARYLEHLIAALNLLHSMEPDPATAAQISEGASVAVHVSNILHRMGSPAAAPASVSSA